MIDKVLDMLIDEKMGCKEYEEIIDMLEDGEEKEMFKMIKEQEHNHYKMIREYIEKMIED